MTRTPDEIKKGLECCTASYADCHRECPYKPDCDGSQILKDSLAIIQRLQAENAEQAERIQQLEAERDALLKEMRVCIFCDRDVPDACPIVCEHCELDCPCKDCVDFNKWQRRGVQKEDGNGKA